jgi:hypothetical protein
MSIHCLIQHLIPTTRQSQASSARQFRDGTARYVGLLAFFLCFSSNSFASDAPPCPVEAIEVLPVEGTDSSEYRGKSSDIEVVLQNFKKGLPVTTFPEPPATIISKGGRCDISGGIWYISGFLQSFDGSTLISAEYSGSEGSLVFYETSSCKVKSSIEIGGYRPIEKSGQLGLVNFNCHLDCPLVKSIPLNSRCEPK